MFGRTEWRVRTQFRDIALRIRRSVGGPAPPDSTRWLCDVTFELRASNPSVIRAVGEILGALEGMGEADTLTDGGRALDESVRQRMERALLSAVRAGAVTLDEVRTPFVPLLAEPLVQEEPETETAAEEELTFISIELRTKGDDRPANGRHFRIELPDGEVREGWTGLDGKARVDGIRQGGTAIVTVPDPDEGPSAGAGAREAAPAEAPAEEEPALFPIEITLREGSDVMADAAYELTLPDGSVRSGRTDEGGAIRIPDNTLSGQVMLMLTDAQPT